MLSPPKFLLTGGNYETIILVDCIYQSSSHSFKKGRENGIKLLGNRVFGVSKGGLCSFLRFPHGSCKWSSYNGCTLWLEKAKLEENQRLGIIRQTDLGVPLIRAL